MDQKVEMESAGSHASRKRKHSEMVAHHAMNVFNATMLLSMVIIHELEMNESAVACVSVNLLSRAWNLPCSYDK